MKDTYRAAVHYKLKKGTEEKAFQFLEKELINKAPDLGCHYIELWQNGKDFSTVTGIAAWDSLEEAKKFQSFWAKKEKEFISLYCTQAPRREFNKLRHIYMEKARKVA